MVQEKKWIVIYPKTFDLARQVVERSYPSEDVLTCRTLKQKYGRTS